MVKKIFLVAIVGWCGWLLFYFENKPVATEINWQMLGIAFKKTWYEPYKTTVDMPVFSDTLKKLNGKLVTIKGFVIPMEYGSKTFALSKSPNSSCFFCGQGGVETIIIVNCKNRPIDFPNDAFIRMTGKLVLNNSFNDFIYTLSDAYWKKKNLIYFSGTSYSSALVKI